MTKPKTEKTPKTFRDFLMRESAHETLAKVADYISGSKMVFNDRVFSINENQTEPDYIEGTAENREDAAKIMKILRKNGLCATRYGACGIMIRK